MSSDAAINHLADATKAQTRVLVAIVVLLLLVLIVFAWDLYATRKEEKFDSDRYITR